MYFNPVRFPHGAGPVPVCHTLLPVGLLDVRPKCLQRSLHSLPTDRGRLGKAGRYRGLLPLPANGKTVNLKIRIQRPLI